uniref:Secreted protein n=1 Tax=Opuntia streptacantha TaxID=393608 RepID=A0A7C9EUZ4_OPUST
MQRSRPRPAQQMLLLVCLLKCCLPRKQEKGREWNLHISCQPLSLRHSRRRRSFFPCYTPTPLRGGRKASKELSREIFCHTHQINFLTMASSPPTLPQPPPDGSRRDKWPESIPPCLGKELPSLHRSWMGSL